MSTVSDDKLMESEWHQPLQIDYTTSEHELYIDRWGNLDAVTFSWCVYLIQGFLCKPESSNILSSILT